MATLSVIVPNYNHARYLPGALMAVAAQSRPADEILIIDDCSQDNSFEIISAWVETRRRAWVLRNPANLGVHETLNVGLREVDGDYVCCPGADDQVLPGLFAESMAVLGQHSSAGLCFSDPAYIRDQDGETRENRLRLSKEPIFMTGAEVVRRHRRRRFPITGHTAIIRTDLFREIGGFETELRWHADWFALWVLAFRHGACYVPQLLARMRLAPQTYSAGANRTFAEERVVYRKMLELLESPKYADVAMSFRDSCVMSTFGIRFWKCLREEGSWRRFRTAALFRAIVHGEIWNAIGTHTPRWAKSMYRSFRGLTGGLT